MIQVEISVTISDENINDFSDITRQLNELKPEQDRFRKMCSGI